MEIHVPRADADDAKLAHERGGVRVMHEIAGEPRKLGDPSLNDIGMAFGRHEHPEPRRGEKPGDERKGL
jgi:hypothetical protein